MLNRIILLLLLLITSAVNTNLHAQSTTATHYIGYVYGLELNNGKQDTIPLIAANVFWMNTSSGAITNDSGKFYIQKPKSNNAKLIINYVSYKNDTISVKQFQKSSNIYLSQSLTMNDVTIQAEKPLTYMAENLIVNTKTLTGTGLRTMACCSMAESFENMAAVDVEQTDAISGTKRIKMLGLAGFYTQIMIEKKPIMRGLISPFGLEYIPGFWMESIDISKGTASVVTGYESMTGQINVELKKPDRSEPLTANVYQNSMGKTEMALTLAKQLTPKLSTMLLSNGSYNSQKWDKNSDTFMDMPLISHINIMNRWKYFGEKRRGQLGFKIIHDHRDGGQKQFDFNNDKVSNSIYGSHNKIRRYEFFVKSGLLLDNVGSSVAIILSGYHHDQESFWGAKTYSGKESSIYANLLYQKSNERHKYVTGISYMFDDRDESYLDSQYKSDEKVPGIFAEYTYQIQNRLTLMAGFRYDEHSQFGSFYTPRFHTKFQIDPLTSLRFSLGKGYRNPHVFMENPVILASSKELIFQETLKAEEAWNSGIQLVRNFSLGTDKPASLSFDYYRTEFQNQVIVDMEQNPEQILLYNLDGKSFSNSAQLEMEAMLFKGFQTTAAVRLNDVKATYKNQLREVPLNSRYKGLLVLSYSVPNNKWQFDFTSQFNGKSRLPDRSTSPAAYRVDEFSPQYVLLFTQIKRKFSNWEIYTGVENITNYKQKNPILAWNEPFSPYFDSSLIWGPTIGRRIYIGVRFN